MTTEPGTSRAQSGFPSAMRLKSFATPPNGLDGGNGELMMLANEPQPYAANGIASKAMAADLCMADGAEPHGGEDESKPAA